MRARRAKEQSRADRVARRRAIVRPPSNGMGIHNFITFYASSAALGIRLKGERCARRAQHREVADAPRQYLCKGRDGSGVPALMLLVLSEHGRPGAGDALCLKRPSRRRGARCLRARLSGSTVTSRDGPSGRSGRNPWDIGASGALGRRRRCVPSGPAPSLLVREFALREDVEWPSKRMHAHAPPGLGHAADRVPVPRSDHLHPLSRGRRTSSRARHRPEVLQATGVEASRKRNPVALGAVHVRDAKSRAPRESLSLGGAWRRLRRSDRLPRMGSLRPRVHDLARRDDVERSWTCLPKPPQSLRLPHATPVVPEE